MTRITETDIRAALADPQAFAGLVKNHPVEAAAAVRALLDEAGEKDANGERLREDGHALYCSSCKTVVEPGDVVWDWQCADCGGDISVVPASHCPLCAEKGAEIAALQAQVAEASREYRELRHCIGEVLMAWPGEMPDRLFDPLEARVASTRAALAAAPKVIAREDDIIQSDGTPGWYQAGACWAGPDDGEGYVGRPVTALIIAREEDQCTNEMKHEYIILRKTGVPRNEDGEILIGHPVASEEVPDADQN